MGHDLPRDDSPPAGVKSWQLWFSLGAGVAVWLLHLMIVYPLTSLTCEWGWFPFTVAGLDGLQIIQIIVTIIAAAITIVAGYLGLQNARQLRTTAVNADRHYFMAWLALALNILFAALIVIAIVPIVTLPICG